MKLRDLFTELDARHELVDAFLYQGVRISGDFRAAPFSDHLALVDLHGNLMPSTTMNGVGAYASGYLDRIDDHTERR